jgi:hypothetical protein
MPANAAYPTIRIAASAEIANRFHADQPTSPTTASITASMSDVRRTYPNDRHWDEASFVSDRS